MEVATSIGVIAFALVALLGVFPLGLENSRFTIADTRATQLMKTVSATLQSESFTAADCFGKDESGLPSINFTTLGSDTTVPDTADAVLFASYDVNSLPRIVRKASNDVPPDAIYRIELRCRREIFTPLLAGSDSGSGASSPVMGTNINMKIFGVRDTKKPFAESWIYLPNITRQ